MQKILINNSCVFPNANIVRQLLFQNKNIQIIGIDDLENESAIKNLYIHRNHIFCPGFIEDPSWLSIIDKLHSPEIGILSTMNGMIIIDARDIKNCKKWYDTMSSIDRLSNLKHLIHLISRNDKINISSTNSKIKHLFLHYDLMFGLRQECSELIPQILKGILLNEKVVLSGSFDEEREFLFIEDLGQIIQNCLDKFNSDEPLEGHFNLKTNFVISQGEMAQKICSLLGKGYNLFSFAGKTNSEKKNNDYKSFDFIPTNFTSSLEKTIDWYLHNQWFLK